VCGFGNQTCLDTLPDGVVLIHLQQQFKLKNMKEIPFSSIVIKTTLVHTVTYFLIGLLSFVFLDYSARYVDPAVSIALRQTDHPLVTAGPLFQVLRGFLFGVAFYALRDVIFRKQRGWLTLWLVLLIVGIFSPFSSAPGSIEGIVYSTLPMWFHMLSLPELIIQSFLLASLTHYLVNHPDKAWLSFLFGILFIIIVILTLLGILSALGFLPAR
jgi:hypothetical protein